MRLYGLSLVRSGKAAEALPLLSRARRLAWREPLAHLHFGIGLHEAGRFAQAAAVLRRAASLAPSDPAVWMNFSAALLRLDKAPAARAAAQRAVALAPAAAESHYTLGLAQMAAGEPGLAIEAFTKAIERRETFADAWLNLGLAAYRRGQFQRAMEAMRSALSHDPGHGAAEANLAAFMLLAGDGDAAHERLRAVLARDPSCLPARLNLANALLHRHQAHDALALLDAPPPAGREGQYWRAHRVQALIQLARWPQARDELDRIAEPYLDAELIVTSRRFALALHDNDEAQATALAERISALAETEAPLLEHRIIGDFDMARFHDRAGRKDRAIDHWTRGHRLLARFQPFSREAYRAFVDASVARFDAARLRDGPCASNANPTPVFIVGMPRSGTTLTEQILNAHAQVHGAGERPDLQRLVVHLTGEAETVRSTARLASLDRDTLDAAATAYMGELQALAPEAAHIVDKMPGNARFIGFIACLLPGAKIINCRRDPRDIGLSIYQLRFFGHHPYAHDLGDLGFAIAEHERLMAHWRAVLPDRILDVELVDWVENFDATLARVLAFLGLPPDEACARFHEQTRRVNTASAAQVRRPINRNGIGRFQSYAAHLEPLFAELDQAGLMPSDPPDVLRRAAALREAGRLAASCRVLEAGLVAAPGHAPLLAALAVGRLEIGQQGAARAAAEAAVAATPEDPAIHGVLCTVLAYCPDVSGAELTAALRRCGGLWPRSAAAPSEKTLARTVSNGRWRLGLLGLFHASPVTALTQAALAALDPAAFDIVCLSVGDVDDAVTAVYRELGTFRDLRGLDDDALAEAIRVERLDLLVDLSGYLRGGRLSVLARRVAPVQIKWVGAQYHTTGIAEVDWFITDARETPADLAPLYDERLLAMPRTYVCWTPPADAPAPGPGQRDGTITFGSCNSLMKITSEVITAWAAILNGVPGSRLIVAAPALSDDEVAERLRVEVAEAGIARERLILKGAMPQAEILQTLAAIDIGLMPFPYGGGVSLLEALWMGVPCVTLAGESFAARHGVSHLGALDLDDWVAGSIPTYIERAIAAAADGTTLRDLRATLRSRVQTSPLCDAPAFAEALGAALRSVADVERQV